MRMMGVPLVLRGPVARGDQDRELLEPLRQRAPEAHVFAELLRAVRQLRAAEQRVERPAHSAARPGRNLLVDLALRAGHVAFAQHLEARLAASVHDSSVVIRQKTVLSDYDSGLDKFLRRRLMKPTEILLRLAALLACSS